MDIFNTFDVEGFRTFEEEGYTDEEALALSKGLLAMSIPCLEVLEKNLTETDIAVIKAGIYEMAKYIKVDYFNFEAATSPFQSETIGSYTYSKMMTSVRTKTSTGVPGYDRAVDYLADRCNDLDPSSEAGGLNVADSEQVFAPDYQRYRSAREAGTRESGGDYRGPFHRMYAGTDKWWG